MPRKLIFSILAFLGILFFEIPSQLLPYLFTGLYLFSGIDIIIKAAKNISRGNIFNENFLITIATLGAMAIQEYPEAIAVILLYQIGMYFQGLAIDHSRKSIADLMDIRPDYANLLINNKMIKVTPSELKKGDFITVKPGERVPVDGRIVEGSSSIDTSSLTGESLLRDVFVNDIILSGSINKTGFLKIEVEKKFKDSTVSKILELVENTKNRKAYTENLITRLARYYTPFVIAVAAIIAVLPPIIIGGSFSEWFYRSLIFLVISCPCALVISIPMSFFAGIGKASKEGILIKGGNFLEALNQTSRIVFDKTGTLTKGSFYVTKINPVKGISKEKLLEYAAIAESYSSHPIAKSIINAYGKELDNSKVKNYEELPGLGVKIYYMDSLIIVGNEKLMKKEGISFQSPEDDETLIHLSINNKYSGYIVISDKLKKDSAKTINLLKKMRLNATILTGDNKKIAKKIAKTIGVSDIHYELLPTDKVEKLELILANNKKEDKVIYVGDGINDAPSLKISDIGIAMGGLGSDAAIEAADIVIMNDEPSKLITALKIAKKTRQIVWQNIILTLSVKSFFLIMGSLGLATMWGAVFADVGVTIIAVLNSLRILNSNNASFFNSHDNAIVCSEL